MKNAAIAAFVTITSVLLASGVEAGSDQAGLPGIGKSGAVRIARTTAMPDCSLFVDAASGPGGNGSAQAPHDTIAAAISAAEPGAVICVAEGIYAEALTPGEKHFTLAGGFQRGQAFQVRDSATYVSKAEGNGGSFIRIIDPGPKGEQLTAIDGFEITGYSQAIVRDYYEPQRFDLTNNFIHDNTCTDASLAGAGFALNNVSGTIRDNVLARNSCGRGGAGFLNDGSNRNSVSITGNLIESNAGVEPTSAHGGALYLFGNKLAITGNAFIGNSVTQWGGGLYIGAYVAGGQPTTATLSRNLYRGNRAGNKGGGFFCDDGATCLSDHEVYERNCGDNIYLDSGSQGSGPTVATFDHLMNVEALDVGCSVPGIGVRIDRDDSGGPDTYTFTNATFRGNAKGGDFLTGCNSGCAAVKVTVANSRVQTDYMNGGIAISFEGTVSPASDPVPATEAGQSQSPAAQDAGLALPRLAWPAVTRGDEFMGFPERFNRYYTDPDWQPSQTIYVSPDGSGDGTTRDAPMAADAAVAAARPGTRITFIRGTYQGCLEFSSDNSGTYDAPIVVHGERNPDQSIGVSMTCCNSGRQACFNLEAANHVAIDGFELIGGKYGVRAVGAGYAASEHSQGIAVLSCNGHDQDNDPFFSGQSDWAVWEHNVASGAKKGDGHGIYLSNGSDWNIVRSNETFANTSSDFQINADPASTCAEVGIPFDDPRCDAYAGTGEGGQGASDYFLVDGNFFHHGIGPGANFTSVRRSLIRNNIFGLHATRHNVSFWQETDNPMLGSSDNRILHNLFVSTGRHGVQLANHSTRNELAGNVLLGVRGDNGTMTGDPSALLMEVDDTVGDNIYRSNLYASGRIEGRTPNATETVREDFSPGWYARFPTDISHDPNDFTPAPGAPFLDLGTRLPDATTDRNGALRSDRVDLGPIELP